MKIMKMKNIINNEKWYNENNEIIINGEK